ncbi:MAG: REP element-mobilizing transposase RayT [Marinoscillum sp.]|jgi:REP element-mobilizing transposase RayT
MATHTAQHENETFYFVTFTCYKWLSLFDETKIYDYLNLWFSKLKDNGCVLSGYVIMPNHMHLLIYFDKSVQNLNKTIGESKRFLAYEIIKRLKSNNRVDLLEILKEGVQLQESGKGKLHQVFRLSFDAKPIDESNINEVLNYMHHNPVSGKWNLVDDYTSYLYSSANHYDLKGKSIYQIRDYREII